MGIGSSNAYGILERFGKPSGVNVVPGNLQRIIEKSD